MFKITGIPSAALLLSAALLSGCGDSPTVPSALETSGALAARGANIGILGGTWTGDIGGAAATLVLSQTGSRASGTLSVTSTAAVTSSYTVEGLENKGYLYLNLFDGASLPQRIVGTVSGNSLTGKMNTTVDVQFTKQ